MLRVLVRNWWLLALRGCFALLFSIIAFLVAGANSFWLFNSINFALVTFLFGIFAFGAGIFTMLAGVRSFQKDHGWVLLMLDGIAACLAGILVVAIPRLTLVHLVQIIAVFALVVAGCELGIAARLWRHLPEERFLAFGAAGSMLFGYYLLSHGSDNIQGALFWLAFYALFSGGMMLAFAFRLRNYHALPLKTIEHLHWVKHPQEDSEDSIKKM